MKSLQLSKPHLLVVVGLPGAGKTFFASQFSDTFSAPYLDYGRYRHLVENEAIANQLADNALVQLLRTNQTIVVEGRADTLADRRDIMTLSKKCSYNALFIWVQTEPQTAEQRSVRAKYAIRTVEEFDTLAAKFEILTPSEPYLVISGRHTYASQAKVVLKKLAVARPETQSVPVPNRIVPPRGRIILG
mgnify:CR=1 FL=1